MGENGVKMNELDLGFRGQERRSSPVPEPRGSVELDFKPSGEERSVHHVGGIELGVIDVFFFFYSFFSLRFFLIVQHHGKEKGLKKNYGQRSLMILDWPFWCMLRR
jgi:hypothetical protein